MCSSDLQNDCRYPFKELCGAGVALKLLSGIVEKMGLSFDLITDFMDLAALGTSADLVSMTDENRVIVHYGLQTLRSTRRPGLRELLKIANLDLDRDLSVTQMVFHIAPRINAARCFFAANSLKTTAETKIIHHLFSRFKEESGCLRILPSSENDWFEKLLFRINFTDKKIFGAA